MNNLNFHLVASASIQILKQYSTAKKITFLRFDDTEKHNSNNHYISSNNILIMKIKNSYVIKIKINLYGLNVVFIFDLI